jgi:flagellar basal body-associated protein FliL
VNEPTLGNIERVPVTASEGPGKGGMLKWIIIVLVIIGLAIAVYLLLPQLFSKPTGIIEATGEANRPPTEPQAFGEVYEMSDIVINPAGSRRVFMVSVALEVPDKQKISEVQKRESLLRDNLITLFASQPLEVLIDIKYRQAFRARVKQIMDYQLGANTVTRVFFEKWVFQ